MSTSMDFDESQMIDPNTAPWEFVERAVRPAPGRKTSAHPVWVAVADGIWRNTKAKQRWLYERPIINGRPTFRALKTSNVKFATEERARRIVSRLEVRKAADESAVVVAAVIKLYLDADCPDKQLNERPEGTLDMERANCEMLTRYWERIRVDRITFKTCDDYRAWRITKLERKTPGTRTVDSELNTLNNAFKFAQRKELVKDNPLASRPKYHSSKNVKHCRQFMAADADELHERAGLLFARPTSVVLGFQFLFEAYTGLRTCEVLNWGEENFGKLTPDGKFIHVWRCKGQHLVNPYCFVHDGLQALIAAHSVWRADCHPESRWFFPSPVNDSQPVRVDALACSLKALSGKKVTSHGCRAFYVTVRRSHGVSDAQIAYEIGHTTGGTTLSNVYGGVPPNWRSGDGPKLAWMPSNRPAWELVLKNSA